MLLYIRYIVIKNNNVDKVIDYQKRKQLIHELIQEHLRKENKNNYGPNKQPIINEEIITAPEYEDMFTRAVPFANEKIFQNIAINNK